MRTSAECGITILWKGKCCNEIGYDSLTGKELVFVDAQYFRPAEVDQLIGDASKAYKAFGWKPKITFKELVKEMMAYEIYNIQKCD